MRVSTAIFIAFSTVVAQVPLPPPPPPMPMGGQPPRDTVQRPDPKGTATIRGRVVTADTGSPVKRANVNLQPMGPPPTATPPAGVPVVTTTTTMTVRTEGGGIQSSSSTVVARPRTVTTDAQGSFEFAELPAGTYRVFASPGQYTAGYLSMNYGAKRPNTPGSFDPGTPITLADGQRFDKATIALPRGGVITGRISDDGGEALARVQVYPLFFPPGSARGQRSGMTVSTDDLGQFRLYGLASGEYVVVAEARGPTFVQPNAQPESEEDKTGFMTTYYPGTPDEGSAQRVRVRAGAETPGIEIRMATGRLFRITGTVTDSQGRFAARTSGQLFRRVSTSTSSFGFSTDEQGRFAMRNIPPGSYRLMVRGRNVGGQDGQPGEPSEMGIMPLTVNSDIEGIVLMTVPGAAISGQVVFDNGPPQLPPGQQSFQMRVTAAPGDPENMGMMGPPQAALVTPDLTFTMKGLFGEMLLRSSGPNIVLKSVTVNGQDITDTPREFKSGEQVTLVMTTRASTLEGLVTDAAGKPVIEAAIMVFSDDKAAWRFNSTRTRRAGADATGKYKVTGLLPGRYYIVAIARERMNVPSMNQDAAWFEQLAKEATTFVIGEDEQRQVDVKISVGSGGAY